MVTLQNAFETLDEPRVYRLVIRHLNLGDGHLTCRLLRLVLLLLLLML